MRWQLCKASYWYEPRVLATKRAQRSMMHTSRCPRLSRMPEHVEAILGKHSVRDS
jgi:hypothetical protein